MKAVSGFANGDGGLIVWGVDCRKNDDGIDAAKELKAIRNAAGVLSQIRDNPSQVTSPVVDGVEHKLIPGSEAGSGFLVSPSIAPAAAVTFSITARGTVRLSPCQAPPRGSGQPRQVVPWATPDFEVL